MNTTLKSSSEWKLLQHCHTAVYCFECHLVTHADSRRHKVFRDNPSKDCLPVEKENNVEYLAKCSRKLPVENMQRCNARHGSLAAQLTVTALQLPEQAPHAWSNVMPGRRRHNKLCSVTVFGQCVTNLGYATVTELVMTPKQAWIRHHKDLLMTP